jgi:hypothetical protein
MVGFHSKQKVLSQLAMLPAAEMMASQCRGPLPSQPASGNASLVNITETMWLAGREGVISSERSSELQSVLGSLARGHFADECSKVADRP